jgi:hypothetical protein
MNASSTAKVTAANARHVTSGKTFGASSAETSDTALVNTPRESSSEATHVSSDANSAEISDVALVNTSRASSSKAPYASSDVTKTAPVSSAPARLCISGKKAAGKRRTC